MVGKPSSRPSRDADSESAQAFGERFFPDQMIAIGGMGELRRYRDSVLSRDVVVKSIRGDQRSNEVTRQRFLREARIQAYLQHPCIVPVYDMGNASRSDVYFTMAHIGGRTLGEILLALGAGDEESRRRFSRRQLLDAFCRVCLAVAYAHEKGVIHRDLKPDNLMLGEYGEVFVLDWGIAKLDERALRRSSGEALRRPDSDARLPRIVYEEDADDAQLTEAGATIGTLEYIAPEQYLASGEPDARSDIYSLGAILYEILSHVPYRSAPSRVEMMKVVWRDTLRPIVRPAPANLPEELDAIWRKATEATPERRFQTARELHDAVVAHLDTEREVQRRRETALEHARTAALEIESAPESELASETEVRRGRALRSLGQALAVDPSQGEAIAGLLNGLLSHPADASPEVDRELAAVEGKVGVRSAGMSAVLFATWFLFLMIGYSWMGVRSRTAMCVFGAVVLALVVYNYRVWRADLQHRGHMMAIMVLGFVAVALASTFLGPFVLVPSLATTMFGAFTMTMRSDARARNVAMVLSACAVVVPAGLQITGVLPASYLFEEGRIIIVPQLVALPTHITPAVLTASALLVVVLTNWLTSQVVQAHAQSERAAVTQAFRLRQLLPGSPSIPPPSSRG